MESCVKCGSSVDTSGSFWTQGGEGPDSGFLCSPCVDGWLAQHPEVFADEEELPQEPEDLPPGYYAESDFL